MTIEKRKSVFLADDDEDDCLLFEDALREVTTSVNLKMANDGIQLMDILHQTVPPPPDVIFLDLNMPLKNGFECLEDIKRIDKLKNIPVVIFSTSAQEDAVNKVYEGGASFFICKPKSFDKLKAAIREVLAFDWSANKTQPPKEKFLLGF